MTQGRVNDTCGMPYRCVEFDHHRRLGVDHLLVKVRSCQLDHRLAASRLRCCAATLASTACTRGATGGGTAQELRHLLQSCAHAPLRNGSCSALPAVRVDQLAVQDGHNCWKTCRTRDACVCQVRVAVTRSSFSAGVARRQRGLHLSGCRRRRSACSRRSPQQRLSSR